MSKFTSKLHNTNILILGGTSGIGYTLAEACLELHCSRLTLAGSSQNKAETAHLSLRQSYPPSDFPTDLSSTICDLSDPDSLESNITTLLDIATDDRKYLLDHIIITSGDSFTLPPLSDITVSSFLQAGTVRFMGSLILAKLSVAYLHPSYTSSLTLTGGSMSQNPTPGWITSASWTAAKEGLTRSLAVEMAPIRVNCVCPGVIQTGWFDKLDTERRDALVEKASEKTLLKRLGTAEDVAEAYLWCMKDNYVTGQTVHSNGGYFLA